MWNFKGSGVLFFAYIRRWVAVGRRLCVAGGVDAVVVGAVHRRVWWEDADLGCLRGAWRAFWRWGGRVARVEREKGL